MALVQTPDGRTVLVPDFLAPQPDPLLQVASTLGPRGTDIEPPPPPPPPPPPVAGTGHKGGSQSNHGRSMSFAAPMGIQDEVGTAGGSLVESPTPSVTGGALPTEQQSSAAAPVQNGRDFVAGTADNTDKAIAAGNQAFDQRAAFAASPEGRSQAAEQAGLQAFDDAAAAGQQVANVDAQSANDKYNALLEANQKANAIDTERQRIAAEREKIRAQKEAQVDRYVHDADNFKLDENKFWGDASTAKNIGRVIAMALTGIGMALQGRGHEQNPVIAMFDEAAKRSVQLQMDQRDQLRKKADRAQQGLDAFDRISDAKDARFNADMARAYDRGIRMGDLAVAKYGDQRAQANWKAQKADMEARKAEYLQKGADSAFNRDVQKQQLANQQRQTDISAGHLGLAREQQKEGVRQFDQRLAFDYAQLDNEAQKAAAAGNAKQAEMVLERGIPAPATSSADANGNVTLNEGGILTQKDGTPFIPRTKDEALAIRAKMEQTANVVRVMDRIRSLAQTVGKVDKWTDSPEYKELKTLVDQAVVMRKNGEQGFSSDGDMQRIESMLGVKDVTAFRSAAKALDAGREETIASMNTKLKVGQGYTGNPITFTDPLKNQAQTTAAEKTTGNVLIGQGQGYEGGAQLQQRTLSELLTKATDMTADPASRAAAMQRLEQGAANGSTPDIRQAFNGALTMARVLTRTNPSAPAAERDRAATSTPASKSSLRYE